MSYHGIALYIYLHCILYAYLCNNCEYFKFLCINIHLYRTRQAKTLYTVIKSENSIN